ncbi:general substrate transporter [Geopyxis carbonaria]|nr:general substrate transporter [Geopyxis carbonaria]
MKLRAMKMRNLPPYVWCAAFTSIGGFVFGFDTGSIGPVTLMPAFKSTFGTLTPTIQGLLVSSILLPAALSSLLAGPLSDRFSRTHTISAGATLFSLGALICALSGLRTPSLAPLFVGRCIAGLGEGLFLSPITVYTLEISPRAARGRVAGLCQLFISTGIMVGYFTCYGTLQHKPALSWRTPFVVQIATSTLLAAGAPWLPHSPRWLLLVGRRPAAAAALTTLGVPNAEAAEVLAHSKAPTSGGTLRASWAPALRSRTALAVYMMATQQLAGIDGVLYYAPMLFSQAGLSSSSAAFLASGVTGIVNVVFTALAQAFMDRFRRRPVLLYGGVAMAAAMTTIGALYSHPATAEHPAAFRSVVALIFVYFIAFIVSWGIVVRIHVSEAQPVHTRASVAAQAQSANWVVNWVVAFTTPMFLERSKGGPYLLWAASIWVAVGVWWLVLPETRGVELGEGAGKYRWPRTTSRDADHCKDSGHSCIFWCIPAGNVQAIDYFQSAIEISHRIRSTLKVHHTVVTMLHHVPLHTQPTTTILHP